MAGLADAVVVVESHEKGGSLITARMAMDYNRDLFTFPGRPNDLFSKGCNELIRRNQAQLITCADDVIAAMSWPTRQTPKQPVQKQLIGLFDDLSAEQQTLLNKLQDAEEGIHINLLVMEVNRPYSEVASDLVELELQHIFLFHTFVFVNNQCQ